MGRRTLLLITSVLQAAIGTALVALYVREASARVNRAEATASYLVAARTLPAGSPITADDLGLRVMRVRDQIRTSLTNPDDAIGRTSTVEVQAGTVIDSRQLTRPGAQAQGPILPGERGIDVALQDPNRAVSLLGVGSTVEILRVDERGEVDVLAARARVISIGGRLEPSGAAGPDGVHPVGAAAVPQDVVGLAVSEKIAQAIVQAQNRQQELYFTVIPDTDLPDDR